MLTDDREGQAVHGLGAVDDGAADARAQGDRPTDRACAEDLAELPERLDQIDAWIDEGLLDGPELNAADFQIAASSALLLRLADIAPFVADRGAGELARRVCPDFPGEVGAVLPPQWLAPLGATRTGP